jgi:hypothetical protein
MADMAVTRLKAGDRHNFQDEKNRERKINRAQAEIWSYGQAETTGCEKGDSCAPTFFQGIL